MSRQTTETPGRVFFSQVDPFLEELERDQELVDRRIVRLSFLTRRAGFLAYIYVVATARVAGDIYRLDFFAGDLLGSENDTAAHAEAARDAIRAACARLKLDVRDGILGGMT